MSFKRYSNSTFQDVKFVKKNQNGTFQDASFVRKYQNGQWVDVWPMSDLNMDITPYLRGIYYMPPNSFDNPNAIYEYNGSSIYGYAHSGNGNMDFSSTFFQSTKRFKLGGCKSFTLSFTLGYSLSGSVADATGSYIPSLISSKGKRYDCEAAAYPYSSNIPTSVTNKVLLYRNSIPPEGDDYIVELRFGAGVGFMTGTGYARCDFWTNLSRVVIKS